MLVSSSRDPTGYIITTAIPLGKTQTEWESEPLRQFPQISVTSGVYLFGSLFISRQANVFDRRDCKTSIFPPI